MVTFTAPRSSCSSTARLTCAEVVVRTDTSCSAQLSFLCLRREVVSTAALTADRCAQLETAGVGPELHFRCSCRQPAVLVTGRHAAGEVLHHPATAAEPTAA